MSEKRVLRKMKKLASRINDKMETVRDVVEDLEIEFELLQNQISKLESKKGLNIDVEANDDVDEGETLDVSDSDEVVDLENTSVVTVRTKF
jgi:predicted  nucleic acid-binding Zn-ribbon protein